MTNSILRFRGSILVTTYRKPGKKTHTQRTHTPTRGAGTKGKSEQGEGAGNGS